MKEVKTCPECGMEFKDMEMTQTWKWHLSCCQSKIEEMVKKAANKVLDYNLHSEGVL